MDEGKIRRNERKGESRAREMEGKDVLRGVLVGDQANGTQWAEEEFILSTLCIRGVHGPIQICCALVLVASQAPVCSIGMSGISQKLGDGAGWGQPGSVLPSLVSSGPDSSVDLHVRQSTA